MKEKILRNIPSMWIPMVFVVMTFYMDDAYFNLLGSKVYIFLLMALLYTIGILWVEKERPIELSTKGSKEKKKMPLMDVMVISFVLLSVISTLFSPYKADAFMGTYGWNVGTLYIVALGGIYYMVSRYMKWQNWMYWVIFASTCVVFLWAVTDELYMDIFGMHAGIVEETAYNYLASIGNNNWFAGYWTMLLPFFLFGIRKGPVWRNIVIGAGLFLMIFTGINARPDSLYMGFAMVYALGFLRAIGEKEKSFYTGIGFIITGLSSGMAKIVRNHVHMIEIDEIALKFVNSQIWLILIIVGVLLLFMPDLKCKKIIRTVVVILLACVLVEVVIKQAEVFGPEWGTLRGRTWMVAVKAYKDSNLLQKIIGVGPDCFGHVYLSYTGSDWVRNAHNEYLQYLVTMGGLGLIIYIGTYMSALVEVVKNASAERNLAGKESGEAERKMQDLPLSFMCFAGIIGYATQALVTNPQGLNGAILITLLAILRGVDYTKKKEVI